MYAPLGSHRRGPGATSARTPRRGRAPAPVREGRRPAHRRRPVRLAGRRNHGLGPVGVERAHRGVRTRPRRRGGVAAWSATPASAMGRPSVSWVSGARGRPSPGSPRQSVLAGSDRPARCRPMCWPWCCPSPPQTAGRPPPGCMGAGGRLPDARTARGFVARPACPAHSRSRSHPRRRTADQRAGPTAGAR